MFVETQTDFLYEFNVIVAARNLGNINIKPTDVFFEIDNICRPMHYDVKCQQTTNFEKIDNVSLVNTLYLSLNTRLSVAPGLFINRQYIVMIQLFTKKHYQFYIVGNAP